MGWTTYHATHRKANGDIDRKAECDGLWDSEFYEVVKSTMVGKVYYAAITQTATVERGSTILIPETERRVFGVVVLTSVDSKDYYNFGYKEMTESMGPGYYDCPKSILNLLTETDSEYALEWRRKCIAESDKKARGRAKTTRLRDLPLNSVIAFKSTFTNHFCGIHTGDEIRLTKTLIRTKEIWTDGKYTWKTSLIPESFEVVKEA